ncbi:hypothetical protein BDV3_006974 [Batrachochytrium dendrobatidis]|nr:hypothetical protein QVD99_007654 [Batrachochytrium dendrobatidis]
MTLLEWCAILLTVGMFLTNFNTLRLYMRTGTTGHATTIPFVCTLLNCSLWFRYGLLVQLTSLVIVNAVGILVSIVSLYVFCKYTDRQSDAQIPIITALGFLYLVFVYVHLVSGSAMLKQYGFLTATFSIFMYGAPLLSLANVIQLKSATGLISLPMTCISLIVCCLWTAFGYQIQDNFVLIPNTIGGILCLFQLIVLRIYPDEKNGYTIHQPSLPMSDRRSY